MLIEWAIPCRHAEARNGTFNAFGGGQDTFRCPEFPAEVSLWLALRITAGVHEFGELEHIRVDLLDPEMHVTELAALELHPKDYADRDVTRQPALIATLPVRFQVEQPGLHTLQLRLQDRQTAVPLFIRA